MTQESTQTRSPLRIVWALDAFEDSPEVFGNSIRLLRSLSERFSAEIEPVYVLGPKQLNISTDMNARMKEAYVPAAIKALHHRLKQAEMPKLLPPHVIVNFRSSHQSSAGQLLAHAKSHKAGLILAGSHGRKGLSRLLLGSFAEELMLASEIPIMTVGSQGPQLPKGDRIKRILFPTDFREEALPVFRQVVDFAKRIEAEVALLHVVTSPLKSEFQSGVYLLSGGWIPYSDYAVEETEAETAAMRSASEWVSDVSTESAPIEIIIDRGASSVTESILKHADATTNTLIAMTAQSGRLSSAVIGSIAREVVRSAAHPVWVCRTKLESSAV